MPDQATKRASAQKLYLDDDKVFALLYRRAKSIRVPVPPSIVAKLDKGEIERETLSRSWEPARIGARMPVHEAWCAGDLWYDGRVRDPPQCIRYRADNSAFWWESDKEAVSVLTDSWGAVETWKSSFLMPTWASRLLVEVTGSRAHTLLNITDADAVAEGAFRHRDGGWSFGRGDDYSQAPGERGYPTAREAFLAWWDRTHGKRRGRESFTNPWVCEIKVRAEMTI